MLRSKVALGAAVGMAAALFLPLTVTAFTVYAIAWWRGWSMTRARFIIPVAWAIGLATVAAGVSPLEMLRLSWQLVLDERYVIAWVPLLPLMIPTGVTVGALMWALRCQAARSGAFSNPRAAALWEHRLQAHAMRRARAEARRPGLTPMVTRRGDLILGRAALVTEGAAGSLVPRDPRHLVVPLSNVDRHMVVIGEPGAGKTVLLLRFMRAWLEAAWLRHLKGEGDRPLLIFIDCKGGSDGVATAERFAAMCRTMGLREDRVGLWPSAVRLDLWTLPPERLTEVLVEMVRSDHPFYRDIQDELVALAVLAPCGPPVSSTDFIRRLSSDWLLRQYHGGRPAEREIIEQNRQHFASIAARYRTTFRRLGVAFDSGRHLDDFDALCLTLEGTQNRRTASVQAQAVMELATDFAVRGGPDGGHRKGLIVIDEFSAVAETVSVAPLMERFRSLGYAVVPVGHGWTSLGPTPDERRRLFSAAAGGALLMGTSDADDVARVGGRRPYVDAATRRTDGDWDDDGLARADTTHLVPPDWLRQLGSNPGQVVYLDHGRATWGVVSPVEVYDRAPGIRLNTLHKAVAATSYAAIPRGDRLPLAELVAGQPDEETTELLI